MLAGKFCGYKLALGNRSNKNNLKNVQLFETIHYLIYLNSNVFEKSLLCSPFI